MMPYCTSYFKFLFEWFWGFPEQNKDFAIQNMGEWGGIILWALLTVFLVIIVFSMKNIFKLCCFFIFVFVNIKRIFSFNNAQSSHIWENSDNLRLRMLIIIYDPCFLSLFDPLLNFKCECKSLIFCFKWKNKLKFIHYVCSLHKNVGKRGEIIFWIKKKKD